MSRVRFARPKRRSLKAFTRPGAGFVTRTKFMQRRRRPLVVRGYTRTAGFFGRFTTGVELKFHDINLDLPPAAAGTITDSVNKIAQGTTESTRIGRKANIRQINWRFEITLTAATAKAATSELVRVILYLDKQCNGATAGVTDILESADYQSFNNLGNKNRFRTLMDREYSLTAQSGGGDGTTEDYGEDIASDTFYKKVNLPIEFDSTAGAITEIRSNNIGVLIIAKTGGISNFSSKMRLRFSDN